MSYHRWPNPCEIHATVDASCHECRLTGSFEVFHRLSVSPGVHGWYWWPCWPGCLPDGEASGPFATEAEALADALNDGS